MTHPPPAPVGAPPGPTTAPPGRTIAPPGRTIASPASQALAAGAFAVVFAALAVRAGSALWFAAPTAALLLGIVVGLGADLRRFSAVVPGFVAGLITLVGLTMLWAVVLGSFEVMAPYAVVPLGALAVVGTDWWWVERLRPITVATGVAMVVLLQGEVGETLPLALAWFGVVAAALWTMRRDLVRGLPQPVPLDGGAVPEVEPGPARTVAAVGAAWLVGAAVIALVSLVPLWFDSPRTPGRLGPDMSVGPGGGRTSGAPTGTGGDPGPGSIPGDTGGPILEGEDRDIDGDGIPDPDINGDGVPDVDIDGDSIPDVDVDGDGVPDDLTPPEGGAGVAGEGPSPASGGDEGGGSADRAGAEGVARVLGIVVLVLLVAALVALVVRALLREQARRRELAARPWAVRLAERLEQEGARRGRGRRRDEPVTRYTDALAGGVLAHDHLAEVGVALSDALFGARAPSEATGEWAVGVVDEAVEANPLPTWWEGVRSRRRSSGHAGSDPE